MKPKERRKTETKNWFTARSDLEGIYDSSGTFSDGFPRFGRSEGIGQTVELDCGH